MSDPKRFFVGSEKIFLSDPDATLQANRDLDPTVHVIPDPIPDTVKIKLLDEVK